MSYDTLARSASKGCLDPLLALRASNTFSQRYASVFFRRDSIGITRLKVFFSRRSFFIFTRRFFAALVLGRPFIASSFGFT